MPAQGSGGHQGRLLALEAWRQQARLKRQLHAEQQFRQGQQPYGPRGPNAQAGLEGGAGPGTARAATRGQWGGGEPQEAAWAERGIGARVREAQEQQVHGLRGAQPRSLACSTRTARPQGPPSEGPRTPSPAPPPRPRPPTAPPECSKASASAPGKTLLAPAPQAAAAWWVDGTEGHSGPTPPESPKLRTGSGRDHAGHGGGMQDRG